MAQGEAWDYRDWLGGKNIVKQDKEKCPFDAPPKDAKDYQVYRQFHENTMMEIMDGDGFLAMSANCWQVLPDFKIKMLTIPKNGHKGAPIAFACPHVIICDPVNPEDVYFTPFVRDGLYGFYLCKTCNYLLERKKLNIGTATGPRCSKCVEEAVLKTMEKDPTKYHDLRIIK
jgi:hypothetical protein